MANLLASIKDVRRERRIPNLDKPAMGVTKVISMVLTVSMGLGALQLVHSATNIVSNLKDGLTEGTLRSAITGSSPGDTIVFSNGLSGTVLLTNGGHLLINKNLTLQGPGAKAITISGNNSTRVFVITNATVGLSGLTIAGGRVVGAHGAPNQAGETTFGAGLLNWHSAVGAEVTVEDCIFLTNGVIGGNGGGTPSGGGGPGGEAYGGAIFNNTSLTLRNCCFAGNWVAGGNGGDSFIAGGKGGAALGGGVWNIGVATLINCTLATNIAIGGRGGDTPGGPGSLSFPGSGGTGEGSGIYSAYELLISSCTIVSNAATGGAGGSGGISGGRAGGAFAAVRSASGSSTMRNSIIADNAAHQARDVSGDFVSQGFNLVGATNGGTGFGTLHDQVGTTNNPINPLVKPLQDNGGNTPTFELHTNSPAVDQGNSYGESSDQRGAPRPSDFFSISNSKDGSDVGAFELTSPTLNIMSHANIVVLSWSVFSTGSLWSASNETINDWTAVSNMPLVVGNRFYVTNTVSIGSKFFRLRSP